MRIVPCLILLAFFVGCANPPQQRTGRAYPSAIAHELPFEFHDLIPYVTVTSSIGEPLWLILDSGGHGVLLTSDSLQRIPDAMQTGTAELLYQDGSIDCAVYSVKSLRWDDKAFHSIRAEVFDRGAAPLLIPPGFDGALGETAFGGQVVSLNFVKCQASFLADSPLNGPIPARRDGHAFLIQAKIGSARGWFVVDTGTAFSIIDPDFYERTGLPATTLTPGPSGKLEATTTIPRIHVGRSASGPVFAAVLKQSSGYSGILGMNFLIQFGGVSLDFGGNTLSFHSESYDKFLATAELKAKSGEREFAYMLHKLAYTRSLGKATRAARDWLKKAAQLGLPRALHQLGVALRDGIDGFAKDESESFECFRKAALAGHAPSASWLGLSYLEGIGTAKNPQSALKWFRIAARAGDAEGQANLGYAYIQGLPGIPVNAEEGVKWLKRAASRGQDAAQTTLGFCYSKGLGVERDIAMALNLYKQAAKQGNPGAMYNLGWIYEKGTSGTPDKTKAKEWYQRAASRGHEKAVQGLKRLGQGGQK